MEARESAPVEVTLQLHPYLARYAPRIGVAGPQAVGVPPGTTVGALLQDVCGLPARGQFFVALNGRQARSGDVLQDGDRVRVFMQLSGG
jgi:sulfur carrier protein ThiS